MSAKILVGVPTFEGMKYCLDEFISRVRDLSYKNHEVLFVDNSKRDDFFEELEKIERVKVLRDKTNEEIPMLRLINSRNKIIDYALENNFDYIFMLDADVIPPKDILEKLVDCNKEIVSGLYFNFFESSGKQRFLPVAWRSITPEEFEVMKQKIKFPEGVTFDRIQRHMTEGEASSGKLLEVLFASAGCMLISRKIFENIKYSLVDAPEGKIASDDILFMKRVREAGFKIYCHTKLRCDHLIKGKFKRDSKGNLLHPMHPNF